MPEPLAPAQRAGPNLDDDLAISVLDMTPQSLDDVLLVTVKLNLLPKLVHLAYLKYSFRSSDGGFAPTIIQ
jgi:hypothetical protein